MATKKEIELEGKTPQRLAYSSGLFTGFALTIITQMFLIILFAMARLAKMV